MIGYDNYDLNEYKFHYSDTFFAQFRSGLEASQHGKSEQTSEKYGTCTYCRELTLG